jgi:hypothetical protein
MHTPSMSIQSRNRHRLPEAASRGIRARRRQAATFTPAQDHAAAPGAASPDRPEATRQVGRVGGARILRRWSVADLIARAGRAPRPIA